MQFEGIATRGSVVVPSNDTLIGPTVGLYVGLGGDVTVEFMTNDTPVTFVDVPTGTFMPVSVRKVNATGTDAESIVALFDS